MNRKLLLIIISILSFTFQANIALAQSDLVTTADSLLEKKKFDKAIELYKQALNTDKENNSIHQKLSEAKQLKQQASENYQNALRKGQEYIRKKQYKKAIEAFKTALANKPEANYPQLKLNEIRSKYDDPEDERKFERYVQKADSMMENFQYKQALDYYNKALELKPRQVELIKKTKKLNKFIKKQKQREKDYTKTINQAENYFEEKQYEQAIMKYQEASLIQPDKELPGNKIETIRSLLTEEEKKNKTYQKFVDKADSLYMERKFKKAKTAYQEALEVKPSETYPANMLSKIDPAMAEKQQKQSEYNTFIEKADLAFSNKNFQEAISLYKKAGTVNPSKDYPEKQIKKAEFRMASKEEKESMYASAINRGDSLMKSESLKEAKSSYNEALSVFSDKKYPKNQIEKINNKLEKINRLNTKYENSIAHADSLFETDELSKAKKAYNQALTILPGEDYPEQQINRINDITASQKEAQRKYNQLLSRADSLYNANDYQSAKTNYSEALAIFDKKEYAQKQINKIDSLLKKKHAKKENYNNAVVKGDSLFDKNELRNAKISYETALNVKPENSYPEKQINKIDSLIKQQESLKNRYEQNIAIADSLFDRESFKQARLKYRSALETYPQRSYPQQRIADLDSLIQARKEKLSNYESIIAKADSSFENEQYDEALSGYEKAHDILPGKKYPEEKIADINNILDSIKNYKEILARADSHFENENYEKALDQYKKALQIMPDEPEPQKKIRETRRILDKRHQQMMEQYNKIIADADKKYEKKKFSEAIDAYEKAGRINDEADYPGKMIARINKYLKDHSLRKVINDSTTIAGNTQKQFSFQPLSYRDRRQNFIVIQATADGNNNPKVFLNYGKDDTQNGGIVIPSVNASQTKKYIINLTEHSRWYDNENNWINLYVQDGDLKIFEMSIVKGN